MKLTVFILFTIAAPVIAAPVIAATPQANPPVVPAAALAASDVCSGCTPTAADLKRYSTSPVSLPNPDTLPQ